MVKMRSERRNSAFNFFVLFVDDQRFSHHLLFRIVVVYDLMKKQSSKKERQQNSPQAIITANEKCLWNGSQFVGWVVIDRFRRK